MTTSSRIWISKKVLITVKTYPSPSLSFKESVCVAGITEEREWIRLYPIKFRDLPFEKRFKKYDIVQMNVFKDRHDIRPESYRPDPESFQVLGNLSTKHDWAERKSWVLPTRSSSMCEIQKMQQANAKTLGVFRPREVLDFIIEDDEAEWPERKLRALQQLGLFERPKSELEKIPYSFKYSYICHDSGCRGHLQTIYDWEIYALYRNIRNRSGGSTDKIKSDLRNRFLSEVCNESRDTHFFVGNMHWRPNNFIILGVFWPPKTA